MCAQPLRGFHLGRHTGLPLRQNCKHPVLNTLLSHDGKMRLSSKKVWALTIYDTKHSCFWLLGVICRLFSHWKYIFDVLCRAKNQTPGTREKSVARFFVHVAQRRTLSRTSLAVFIFLTFAGCCGTSSVSCLAAPNSRANIPRTLSCKCSDKHCDFNGAGFFLELPLQEIIVAENENND